MYLHFLGTFEGDGAYHRLFRLSLSWQDTAISHKGDISLLLKEFPNLLLRDRTTAPVDIWGSAGEDTLEGMYFKLLRSAMENGDDDAKRQIRIAAQISRQILDGQEVVLP